MASEETKKKIINRLRTIKGHIAGIENMIEDGKTCDDVLMQIAAVKSSINRVGLVILEDHALECLIHEEKEEYSKEEVEKVIKSFVNYTK